MHQEQNKVWDIGERTFEFACRIIRLCTSLGSKAGVNRMIANQLLRSGTSIGADVQEGQGAQSRADFISKYSIALKEARETHYWLRLLVKNEILKGDQVQSLCNEADEIKRILGACVLRARNNSK